MHRRDLSMRADQQGAMVRSILVGLAGVAITVGGLAMILGDRLGRYLSLANFKPHAPDLTHVLAASPLIQLHLTAALTAFAIGVVILIGVKGTALHKALGWGWVVAMATTAVSSLFIKVINPGHFSLIHLLSGWTIIVLPMAVAAIKRGNVTMHARTMTGMFTGGLIIAGLFTFAPGRLMWSVFFS